MSAEDLTTLAGVSVQQDLALVALLGLGHVERNGHHFIDGMSFAPPHEQADFARAHPDLYEHKDGVARLALKEGRLTLTSLDCSGSRWRRPWISSHATDAARPQSRITPRTPRGHDGHPDTAGLPERFRSVAELEDFLSTPPPE